MRGNTGELFNRTLGFCLVVATLVLMMVSSPRPAHADEAEELFKACTGYIGDDNARQALNSCNQIIERYSGDLSRDKLGLVYGRRGVAKDSLEQYTSALSDYRRAIELGNPGGYYSLGVAYLNGHGVPKDKRRGVELIRKGCDLGGIRSCLVLEYTPLGKDTQ